MPRALPRFFIGRPAPRLGIVLAPVGPWTVRLEVTSPDEDPWTRATLALANLLGFRFRIRRATPWHYLKEMLGFGDIAIGEFLFDDAFDIRSNRPELAKALLSDPALRQLIVAHEFIRVGLVPVRGTPPDRSPRAELRFETPGLVQSPQRLGQILRLFECALDGLCRLGATRRPND